MDIEQAQKAIAAILCRLEESTNSTVRSIYIHDLDVTPIGSRRSEVMRAVMIDMSNAPGTMWDK